MGNLWGVACLVLAWVCNKMSMSFACNRRTNNEDKCELRLLTYNINNLWGVEQVHEFAKYIIDQHADVVTFEEITSDRMPTLVNVLKGTYPYISEDCTFFSKYPFCHRKKIWDASVNERDADFDYFVMPEWREMPIYIQTVDIAGKEIWLVQCYMMTNNFNRAKYDMKEGDGLWKRICLTLKYLRMGYRFRAIGAQRIKQELAHVSGPVIVCGDMNDLSQSPSLRLIAGNKLKEAWWEKGLGFGFTFIAQKMLFRLDHILYSKELKLSNIVVKHAKYSDHMPMIADFNFIEK